MALRIEGMEKVRAALDAARDIGEGPALLQRLEEPWDDAVLRIQAAAQKKAPVLHGHLRGSGESSSAFNGAQLVGEVTFGGIASAYAEVQHEEESFEHPKGGQAHYLFGASDSAWEEAEETTLADLDRQIAHIADDYITRAAN